MLGGIVGTLLPLIRNGIVRTLRIGQQVKDAGGLWPVQHLFGRIRIVVVGIRRRVGPSEERRIARHGAYAHRVQLHIGGHDGDVVADLRHAAPHLDGRQHDAALAAAGDRDPAIVYHRKHLVCLSVGEHEVSEIGTCAQVAPHIGRYAQAVAARRTFEPQRRRRLVAVQHRRVRAVVEVEVQVADRVLVRRAGHGAHMLGMHRQLDRHAVGTAA